MFRLARRFDRGPTFLGFYVAVGARAEAIDTTNLVLRSGPLPPTAYDELTTELARHDVAKAIQQAIPAERALCLQMWDDLSFPILGHFALFSPQNDRLRCLELFEAGAEQASRPYWDARARKSIRALIFEGGMMFQLLAPAVGAPTRAVAQTQAKLRSLFVLRAILVREQTGQTEETKLVELDLPTETTTDPFTGRPLHVKKTADGWLIYSVGENTWDDGGLIDDGQTDVGLGPVPQIAGRKKSGAIVP